MLIVDINNKSPLKIYNKIYNEQKHLPGGAIFNQEPNLCAGA